MLTLKSCANRTVISNAATRCCFGLHQRRHVFFCKSVWGLQKSKLRRRSTPSVSGTYASKSKESESMEENDSDRPDGSWFTAGLVLTAGGLIPSLITCFLAKEVLAMDSMQRLAIFLATDLVFALTSYAFLLVGEGFGRERLEGRAIEPYPGPWKEPSGVRILPKYFRKYLLALPASVGLFLPVATVVASCLWTDNGVLAATCLATYVATLLSQIWMETVFVECGSFMWPMVPVTHMLYRLWQLGRGSVLVAVLDGPSYLQYLHATLAIVWVLNFGAVMAWMPWLYRWHHQPKSSVD